ncbi:MAG: hypothetical protein MK102_09295 [Fuerstiella sp.]|nr:hypothetical protein [Fuerstiella sp.]
MIRVNICVVLLILTDGMTVNAQSSPEDLFRRWDRNQDGVLTLNEIPPQFRPVFSDVDRNRDGKVTPAEHRAGLVPRSDKRAGVNNRRITPDQKIKIRQRWQQEPNGFTRQVLVRLPKQTQQRQPVAIIFHGNGGTAEGSLKRWQWLNDHILIAPQGYRRSWNVYGEASTAPDIEFFRLLIQEVRTTQPTADPERVSLIGSSNGSGFVQRLMIEMDDRPFQKAILLVASLIEQQYHDGSFWAPSQSTQVYDKRRTPKPGLQMVYFHGTEDRVVPYTGGYRGRRFLHLGAQETTWHWARAFGYSGAALSDRDGKQVARGILSYTYADAGVTHYKLVGAGHGIGNHSAQAYRIVKKFLGSSISK